MRFSRARDRNLLVTLANMIESITSVKEYITVSLVNISLKQWQSSVQNFFSILLDLLLSRKADRDIRRSNSIDLLLLSKTMALTKDIRVLEISLVLMQT
jgi:hypothetical protein